MGRSASLGTGSRVSSTTVTSYIVKDKRSSKRINDTIKFDKTTWFKFDAGTNDARKREIVKWFTDLFNKQGEQDVLKNLVIVQGGTLDRLASLAAKSGTAIECPAEFFLGSNQRSDKVIEIGVIRFPRKDDSRIKLFRLEVFAFFKSSRAMLYEHVETGFEIEYNSMEFVCYTDAIDTAFAEKARNKLSDPKTYDW